MKPGVALPCLIRTGLVAALPLLVLLGAAALATAQDRGSYFAEISATDRKNSRGVRLTDLRGILRQDRFNFHTGRTSDSGDSNDGVFGDKQARALFETATLNAAPGLEKAVLSGDVTRLVVTVQVQGNRLGIFVHKAGAANAMPNRGAGGGPGNGDKVIVNPAARTVAAYRTTLGAQDRKSSAGVRLYRLRDILAQDRANVHKFGRADAGDQKDSYFNSPQRRTQFQDLEIGADVATIERIADGEVFALDIVVNQAGEVYVVPVGDDGTGTYLLIEDIVGQLDQEAAQMAAENSPAALPTLQRLVKIAELAHGYAHGTPAVFEATLGVIQVRQGRIAAARETAAAVQARLAAAKKANAESQAEKTVSEFLAFLDQAGAMTPSNPTGQPATGADDIYGDTINEIVAIYEADRHDDALALARNTFADASEKLHPSDARLVELGDLLSVLYRERNDFAAIEAMARPLMEKALAVDDPRLAQKALWHLFVAEHAEGMGRYDDAEWWYREAVSVSRQHTLPPSQLESAYHLLGNLLETSGRFGEAEAIWEEGVERLEAVSGDEAVAARLGLMNDLSLIRKHYRDYAGAIRILEEARRLAVEHFGKDSPPYATASNNLVVPYHQSGATDEALAAADEAIRVSSSHEDGDWGDRELIIHRSSRALVLFTGENKDLPAAEAEYLEIIQLCERQGLGDDTNTGFHLTNLGTAQAQQGKHEQALTNFDKAARIMEQSGPIGVRNLSVIDGHRANSALALGRTDQAADLIRAALQRSSDYRREVLELASDEERLGFGSQVSASDAVPILLAAGATREACETALSAKGLLLESALEESRRRSRLADHPAAAETLTRLASLQARHRQLQLGAVASDADDKLGTLRSQIRDLNAELLQLAEGAGAEAVAARITVAQVQERLGEDEAFLEFLELDSGEENARYGVFEISQRDLRWIELGPSDEINSAVKAFNDAIRRLIERSEGEVEALPGLVSALYRKIWAPLGRDWKSVVLSPGGSLNFLPFAVLVDEDGRFLGESTRIRHVVSARDLLAPYSKSAADAVAVFVGNPAYGTDTEGASHSATDQRGATAGISRDSGLTGQLSTELAATRSKLLESFVLTPLEGAEQEVRDLAKTFAEAKRPTRLLIGTEAVEADINAIDAPDILHIATHGLFFDFGVGDSAAATPGNHAAVGALLRGGLALAGANSTLEAWSENKIPPMATDGWLLAAEAATLRLVGTRLVTLSACDTALGDLAGDEGVVGLRRAFLTAGAANVLSTLWPIADDTTLGLMRDFYRGIATGASVTDAFNDAHSSTLRQHREDGALAEAIVYFGAFVLNASGGNR